MLASPACATRELHAGKAVPKTAIYQRRRPERTLLYRTVQAHLTTWLSLYEGGGVPVPARVEREFRRYLECGILAHGFARARCADCGHDFIIAYSCKCRGVCPSCTTRRMVETAAHLADHVIPHLPVRQWVLSMPKRLRYHLEHDPAIQNVALHIFLSAVEQRLRRCSPDAGESSRLGAVAFIHRFGALLNNHLHFHCVIVDGVFEAKEDGVVAFLPASGVDATVIADVQATVRRRLLRVMTRRGLLAPDEAKTMAAWDHGGGFSVDAEVRIEAQDREGLERLLRYCARPAFALEHLREINPDRLVYESPKPGPGGNVSVLLTPFQLLDRLAALIPPSRQHRHRYYGVFAPHSPLRAAVTAMVTEPTAAAPLPPPQASATPDVPASARANEPPKAQESILRQTAHYTWALLLAHIYEVFPLLCPRCGGEMRIIAFITGGDAIRDILTNLGEPTSPPRLTKVRDPPLWEMQGAEPAEDDSQAQPEPSYEFDQRVAW